MEDLAMEFSNVCRGPLQKFNFSAAPGEKVLVLGPAGGLSLELCQIIMNFLNLDRGRIRVFGRNHRSNEARTKLLLGYIGREINFYPEIRAEQLAWLYSRHYPGWEEKRWADLKRSLKINTRDPVRNWKEGDRERMLLALALARQAEVLIFAGTAELAWQYRKLIPTGQFLFLEGQGTDKWLKESDQIIFFGDNGNWTAGSRDELDKRLKRITLEDVDQENNLQEFFWELPQEKGLRQGITASYSEFQDYMENNYPEVKWEAKNVDLKDLIRKLTGGRSNG